MSILEKLLAARSLIDSALEEAQGDLPPGKEPNNCKHENRQTVTGAGETVARYGCPDCGEKWEA